MFDLLETLDRTKPGERHHNNKIATTSCSVVYTKCANGASESLKLSPTIVIFKMSRLKIVGVNHVEHDAYLK